MAVSGDSGRLITDQVIILPVYGKLTGAAKSVESKQKQPFVLALWLWGRSFPGVVTDATNEKERKVLIYEFPSLKLVKTVPIAPGMTKLNRLWSFSDCNKIHHYRPSKMDQFVFGTGTLLTPLLKLLLFRLKANPHSDVIRDLQLSTDRSYFITASRDNTAKIIDTATLAVLKTFKTERPVNSASISPWA